MCGPFHLSPVRENTNIKRLHSRRVYCLGRRHYNTTKYYIQECKIYIYIEHVTFDIAYNQCYNIKHSDSVLLHRFMLLE